ncbi:MAG: 50S ribosomal protein L24 [Nitrospirae bacterium]|nr:50S ribosomal protein L24 [Nitrospirota bacterium]
MSLEIKKNDTVAVISGDERGKRGRVLSVLSEKEMLLVERLNMIKRHMKPSKKYSQGGIIERESPIRRANVMLLCPKCDKPTRIGQKILENGTKVRTCKKCREVID